MSRPSSAPTASSTTRSAPTVIAAGCLVHRLDDSFDVAVAALLGTAAAGGASTALLLLLLLPGLGQSVSDRIAIVFILFLVAPPASTSAALLLSCCTVRIGWP